MYNRLKSTNVQHMDNIPKITEKIEIIWKKNHKNLPKKHYFCSLNFFSK